MAIIIDLTPKRLLLITLTLTPDGSTTGSGGIVFDETDIDFDWQDAAFDED
jgi:hypothetical protein